MDINLQGFKYRDVDRNIKISIFSNVDENIDENE